MARTCFPVLKSRILMIWIILSGMEGRGSPGLGTLDCGVGVGGASSASEATICPSGDQARAVTWPYHAGANGIGTEPGTGMVKGASKGPARVDRTAAA